jgi:hypothetical protein
MPAWLVSLVFHMVAILLLGIWTLAPAMDDLQIHLSSAVSYQDLPGDEELIDDLPEESFEFEDAGTADPKESQADPASDSSNPFSNQITETSLPNPSESAPPMPRITPMAGSIGGAPSKFFGRNPDARAARLEAEGGTSFTEAAVARGLHWIARHQNTDGSWSLHAFNQTAGCRGKCRGVGRKHCNMAGTALALLPMLGAGQTHRSGKYKNEVDAGLYYILRNQGDDGDLQGASDDRNRSMYAHGLASIVLCEAYGMTGDETLREPAQKAINFIIYAQHKAGGWRYAPNDPGDLSVTGWQLMALRSAQMAYLQVPNDVFSRAADFLDSVQRRDSYGGLYGYMPGAGETPSMTAEGLLCRQYMGWPKDHPGLNEGVAYLLQSQHQPSVKRPNIYYWYYATQVLYHMGGRRWKQWNAQMRSVLTNTQETRGHQAGSWAPRGHLTSGGGRLYMTSLAICILEVYYRHMPLYRSGTLRDFGDKVKD